MLLCSTRNLLVTTHFLTSYCPLLLGYIQQKMTLFEDKVAGFPDVGQNKARKHVEGRSGWTIQLYNKFY